MNKILSFLINLWVGWTGRKQNINDIPWLKGPYGKSRYIGGDFYKEFAKENGLSVSRDARDGLLSNFLLAVNEHDANKGRLQEAVRHFYEHTAQYTLDVRSEWYHPVKYFAHI
ncbi:MAG TPA: hypothetical protein VFL76_09590 [Edaphocola sp.]|nr:hypothetical protein [Edaphocola sp.]